MSNDDDGGQALVEFALAFPLFLLATFYAFSLIDASMTYAGVSTAAQRAATVLAGTNDDAQAAGVARDTAWLRGQQVAVTIAPGGSIQRCPGVVAEVRVAAPGHLGFLLPIPTSWSVGRTATIERQGLAGRLCAGS